MDHDIFWIDCETTGLEDHHEVVEIGVVHGLSRHGHRLVVPHSLLGADPIALEVNRYYERQLFDRSTWCTTVELDTLRDTLSGATLGGAGLGFDDRFLGRLFNGRPWHYRFVDVAQRTAQAAGETTMSMAATVRWLRDRTRLDIPVSDHTALGDAMAARGCWVALCVLDEIAAGIGLVSLCRCSQRIVKRDETWLHHGRDADHRAEPVVDIQ